MRRVEYQRLDKPDKTHRHTHTPGKGLLPRQRTPFRGDSLDLPASPFYSALRSAALARKSQRRGRGGPEPPASPAAAALATMRHVGLLSLSDMLALARRKPPGEKGSWRGATSALRGWKTQTSPRFPPTSPPNFRLAQAPSSRPPSRRATRGREGRVAFLRRLFPAAVI